MQQLDDFCNQYSYQYLVVRNYLLVTTHNNIKIKNHGKNNSRYQPSDSQTRVY